MGSIFREKRLSGVLSETILQRFSLFECIENTPRRAYARVFFMSGSFGTGRHSKLQLSTEWLAAHHPLKEAFHASYSSGLTDPSERPSRMRFQATSDWCIAGANSFSASIARPMAPLLSTG